MHKWILVIGLLLSTGMAENTQKNHDNIGDSTLRDFGLKGKVSKVKICTSPFSSSDCNEVKFNKWGINLADLKNRIVLSAEKDTIVFERTDNYLIYQETFKNGKIVLEKQFKLKTREQVMSRKHTYAGNKIKNITYHPTRVKFDYFYNTDGSYFFKIFNDNLLVNLSVFTRDGILKSETIFRKDGNLDLNYNYEYDSKGNWTKKYLNGKLYALQTITYF